MPVLWDNQVSAKICWFSYHLLSRPLGRQYPRAVTSPGLVLGTDEVLALGVMRKTRAGGHGLYRSGETFHISLV